MDQLGSHGEVRYAGADSHRRGTRSIDMSVSGGDVEAPVNLAMDFPRLSERRVIVRDPRAATSPARRLCRVSPN